MTRIALLLLTALVASTATAQPVYRCGHEYSATPCAQGRVVDAADPRSAEQRADARRVADDERRLGQAMTQDRLARLSTSTPAAAASLGPAPAAAPPGDKPQARKKDKRKRGISRKPATGDFVAIDPDTIRRRKK
jgi:hypothetical protein